MSIEYNGRKEFSRERKLEETETLEQLKDRIESSAFGQENERDEATDQLYSDLAKVYLKGRVLQDALRNMDPAQFIPIEEFADSTRAAARRIAKDVSQNGEIITYSLYQKCVDIVLLKKWEIRGTVLDMKIPASTIQIDRETKQHTSGTLNASSLLKEFISQNGIITTIIGMLTISPFQTIIFQALGVEQAAKGIQVAQIPAGIALFLELGIKAERILAILKDSKVSTPLVEQQIIDLSSSEEARAQAFSDIGLNYDEFKKSQEFTDSEEIIKYVSEYYARYGGLDKPNGHLCIDHWVAYLQVAQNQQTVRSALNTSDKFSPMFQSFRENSTASASFEEAPNVFTNNGKKTSKIFIQLASATRALKESSDTIYDRIASSFVYYLTDRDLCCLVQIFGEIGNPKMMQTIASLLRILAVSLNGEIIRIQNLITRYLANLAQDALFELMANVNEFYYKIAHKIAKTFTIDIKGLEACVGMTALGWALLHAVDSIFQQIRNLLKELSAIIGDFGNGTVGEWEVSADRRHLIGIARILEVLAARLELANTCAVKKQGTGAVTDINDPDYYVNEAIFDILGSHPPIMNISDENIKKHFPDIKKQTSKRLKFSYGMGSEQNNEEISKDCTADEQKSRLVSLIDSVKKAITENFNG